jgi:hypothetical protein
LGGAEVLQGFVLEYLAHDFFEVGRVPVGLEGIRVERCVNVANDGHELRM